MCRCVLCVCVCVCLCAQACTTTIRRLGVCTNWLERKCLPFLSEVCVLGSATLPVFPKPTKDFILPGSTGQRTVSFPRRGGATLSRDVCVGHTVHLTNGGSPFAFRRDRSLFEFFCVFFREGDCLHAQHSPSPTEHCCARWFGLCRSLFNRHAADFDWTGNGCRAFHWLS